jgi:spermidine synthase
VLVVGEARMSNRVAFAWRGTAPSGQGVETALAQLPLAVRTELAAVFERVAAALAMQAASSH